jgi:hypothetical protein
MSSASWRSDKGCPRGVARRLPGDDPFISMYQEGSVNRIPGCCRPHDDLVRHGLEQAVRFARGEPTEIRRTTYLVPTRARARLRPDGVVEISRRPIVVPCRDPGAPRRSLVHRFAAPAPGH